MTKPKKPKPSVLEPENLESEEKEVNFSTLVDLMAHGRRTDSPVGVAIGTSFYPVSPQAIEKKKGPNAEKQFVHLNSLGPFTSSGYPTAYDDCGTQLYLRKEVSINIVFDDPKAANLQFPKIPIFLFSYHDHNEPQRLPQRVISEDKQNVWQSLWRVFGDYKTGVSGEVSHTVKPTLTDIKARYGTRQDLENSTVAVTKNRANVAKDFLGFSEATEWLHAIGNLIAPLDFESFTVNNLRLGSYDANTHMLNMEAMTVNLLAENEEVEYSVRFKLNPQMPWAVDNLECRIKLVQHNVQLNYSCDGFTTRKPSKNDFRAIKYALQLLITKAKEGTLTDCLKSGLVRDYKQELAKNSGQKLAKLLSASSLEEQIFIQLEIYKQQSLEEDQKTPTWWQPNSWRSYRRDLANSAKKRAAVDEVIQQLSNLSFDYQRQKLQQAKLTDNQMQESYNQLDNYYQLKQISKKLDELLKKDADINRPDWRVHQWRMSGSLYATVINLQQALQKYILGVEYKINGMRATI